MTLSSLPFPKMQIHFVSKDDQTVCFKSNMALVYEIDVLRLSWNRSMPLADHTSDLPKNGDENIEIKFYCNQILHVPHIFQASSMYIMIKEKK